MFAPYKIQDFCDEFLNKKQQIRFYKRNRIDLRIGDEIFLITQYNKNDYGELAIPLGDTGKIYEQIVEEDGTINGMKDDEIIKIMKTSRYKKTFLELIKIFKCDSVNSLFFDLINNIRKQKISNTNKIIINQNGLKRIIRYDGGFNYLDVGHILMNNYDNEIVKITYEDVAPTIHIR